MRPLVISTARCPSCAAKLAEKGKDFSCSGCGRVFKVREGKLFLNDKPDDAPAPKREFDSVVSKQHWSAWRRSNHAHTMRHLRGLPATAAILDFGAGRSPFRSDINDVYPNTVSTDFVPYDLVDVVADLSGHVPFADAAFDCIIVSNVLEHVPDPSCTLSELYRMLQPGGIVIAQTPFLMELHDIPYDFYRYTTYAAHHLLAKAGFSNIAIEELSDIFDVRTSVDRGTFGPLINRSTGIRRIVARLLRKSSSMLNAAVRAADPKLENTRYPKGYGWYGKKPVD